MTSRQPHSIPGSLALALAVALGVGLASRPAAAGCNITPAAILPLRSTTTVGGRTATSLVNRPVAAPGDAVDLIADLGGCNAGKRGFDPVPGNHVVTLTFRSPAAGSPRTVVGPIASGLLLPLECAGADCNRLRVTLPDTRNIAATDGSGTSLTTPPEGLAGPVEIRVERPGLGTIAIVFELFQPSTGCVDPSGETPEPDFGSFTMLPRYNPLAPGSQPAPGILGGVDGYGNLVLPLDFGTGKRGDPQEGVLLAPAGTPNATLFEVTVQSLPPLSGVFSFNPFGRPIPPVLNLAANTLIASSDVRFSVLQTRPQSASAFAELMGTDSLGRKTGPVALLGTVEARTVAPLESLRASLGVVAVTGDEALQDQDLTNDGDRNDLSPVLVDLGSGVVEVPGDAVAQVRFSPGVPVIATEGDVVAYALSEANSVQAPPGFDGDVTGNGDAFEDVLRALRATGSGFVYLSEGLTAPMAAEPVVNRSPFALSSGDVFFTTDESLTGPRRTERISEGSNDQAESAHPASSRDGLHVAWDTRASSFPGGNANANVYVTDRTTPGLPPLLASESLGGGGGNADSTNPALSADGEQVAFQSAATDLAVLQSPPSSNAVVWERGAHVFGAGAGTFGIGGFFLEPGAADVPGVDYSRCTDPYPGLELVFAEPPEGSGAGSFDALLLAEFHCFEVRIAGSYQVDPFPLEEGSTIILEGVVTSFEGSPALPAELENLRFSSSLVVTDAPHGGGFEFEGDFELGADAGALGSTQIYARPLADGTTAAVSVSAAGEAGDGSSFAPSLGADGRLVAFASDAANLVPGDTNERRDVFVHDRDADGNGRLDERGTGARATARVSLGAGGAQGTADAGEAAISADGRFVAFASASGNLVSGDGNGASDVFVVPILPAGGSIAVGLPERVSTNSVGAEVHGPSGEPSLSGDGRFVAFASDAPDLVAGDGNGSTDVFVKDLVTGDVERVSVTSGGAERAGPSYAPSISLDGRFVAFTSVAALVPDDTNGSADVYRYDRRRLAIERASVGSDGNGPSGAAALSGGGRSVFFDSMASNLVPNDTNGARDVFGRVYGQGTSLNSADLDDDDLVLQVLRTGVPALSAAARTSVSAVAVRRGRAVVLTPERHEGGANLNAGSPIAAAPDEDLDDDVVQVYDAATDRLLNVRVAATQATIDEILCLAVPEAGEGGAGGTDFTGDGSKDDDVLVVGRLIEAGGALSAVELEVVPVPVGQVAALGKRCVFQQLEAPGFDGNGDGDFDDAVLAIYDDENPSPSPLGRVTYTGRSAAGFATAQDSLLIGFPVCEASEGGLDLNRNGRATDCVEHIWDLSVAPGTTTPLSNTERQTIECSGVPCERFTGVSANGTVSFLGTEPGQAPNGAGCGPAVAPLGGCDLDGNQIGTDTVRHVARVVNGRIVKLSSQFVSPTDTAGPSEEGASGTVWRQRKTECEAALIECPETRSRYPSQVSNGFLTVTSACELAFDIDRTDPGLDCVTPRPWFVGDRDGDGAEDNVDNCQTKENPDQGDVRDGDLLGDQCDNRVSPPPRTCDATGDGFIDQTDVDRIFSERGSVAQGGRGDAEDGLPPTDVRDPDEDGLITASDAGICAVRCDNPDCAPRVTLRPTRKGCGLLGIEPALLLLLVGRRRRC